jgi:protein involved in temperature-dependent protein secretion
MAESTPRDLHYHNDEPHFFSISRLAKHLRIRRETVREAVKSGALKMRHLPGRERPVITHSDKEQWIASLELANVRATTRQPLPSRKGGGK